MADIYQSNQADAMSRVLVSGAETGGHVAVVEVTERRGAEPPLHIHRHEDELIYVLDGSVTFCVEGRRVACGAGGHVLLRRGCEHSYTVDSEQARLLVLLLPAGLEEFYRHRGDDTIMPGLTAIERLVTTAARYGLDITGPAPTPAWGAAPI